MPSLGIERYDSFSGSMRPHFGKNQVSLIRLLLSISRRASSPQSSRRLCNEMKCSAPVLYFHFLETVFRPRHPAQRHGQQGKTSTVPLGAEFQSPAPRRLIQRRGSTGAASLGLGAGSQSVGAADVEAGHGSGSPVGTNGMSGDPNSISAVTLGFSTPGDGDIITTPSGEIISPPPSSGGMLSLSPTPSNGVMSPAMSPVSAASGSTGCGGNTAGLFLPSVIQQQQDAGSGGGTTEAGNW